MVGGTPVTTSESYVNAGKYKLEVDVSRLTVDFTLEDGESKYRYMYIYTGEKFYMNDGPIRYNFNKISQ